jgi:Leucine-rich repeat (LRR) protein
MGLTDKARGVASVCLLSMGLALASTAQPDGRTYTETVGGSQGGGTSSQSSEIERHWQAVAEIEELGGVVTGIVPTSVLIGAQRRKVGTMRVEWQGGGEKLVELLHDLINVRTLDIRGYEIDDAELAQLRDILPGLEQLLLWPTARVTDDGLVYLRSSKGLTLLRLEGCRITDEGLEHLKGMTELRLLSLQRTNITGAGLRCLAGLGNLEALFLEGTRVDDEGLVHLKGLTRLRDLQLSSTDIRGAVHLAEVPNLTCLDLQDTQITDEELEHLKGITGLEILVLSDAKITDAGLVHLRGLKKLQRLHLEGCQITGPGLAHLAELSRLEYLGLARVPITDQTKCLSISAS